MVPTFVGWSTSENPQRSAPRASEIQSAGLGAAGRGSEMDGGRRFPIRVDDSTVVADPSVPVRAFRSLRPDARTLGGRGFFAGRWVGCVSRNQTGVDLSTPENLRESAPRASEIQSAGLGPRDVRPSIGESGRWCQRSSAGRHPKIHEGPLHERPIGNSQASEPRVADLNWTMCVGHSMYVIFSTCVVGSRVPVRASRSLRPDARTLGGRGFSRADQNPFSTSAV
jgi:hypothetical protein